MHICKLRKCKNALESTCCCCASRRKSTTALFCTPVLVLPKISNGNASHLYVYATLPLTGSCACRPLQRKYRKVFSPSLELTSLELESSATFSFFVAEAVKHLRSLVKSTLSFANSEKFLALLL